ncbi:hypothetical protein [Nonomuraea basaltis]|nr:hypothetical protein [Nonomuraea basaltis]
MSATDPDPAVAPGIPTSDLFIGGSWVPAEAERYIDKAGGLTGPFR